MASLKYSPACVPYGALAAALARGLTLSTEEDTKLPRDAPPTLTLPTGCVPLPCSTRALHATAARSLSARVTRRAR